MSLRKIISILISKTVHKIVKILKGSSSHIGGVIALKIDKNILSKLQKPEIIVTVTGTNGKTTVTNLAVDLLELLINEKNIREELKKKKKPIERANINVEDIKKSKKVSVISNKKGSNLKAGIVDTLITNSNIFGKLKKNRANIAIFEVDERVSPYIYGDLKPRYTVITNILRDSVKRNANTDYIVNILERQYSRRNKINSKW